MMKYIVWSLIITALFTGCDAYIHLDYVVKNKAKEPLTLVIPNRFTKEWVGASDKMKDTTLVVQPGKAQWVGASAFKIGFPGDVRLIYKENPGLCGIRLMHGDSATVIDCSNKDWKYKRKTSTLTIQ